MYTKHPQPVIAIKKLTSGYERKTVLRDFNMEIYPGEIVCLLGPSGCGKTSLLRSIAGLNEISTGTISLHDKVVQTPQFSIPANKRKLGMVFQDNALFPHLSVYENVIFGLTKKVRQEPKTFQRIQDLLTALDIAHLQDKYPHEISGGQQQRTSLARSIAPQPRLLLMDEPFTGQDVDLKAQVMETIVKILKNEHITSLIVTHDQNEAFKIADRVAVMNKFHLEQITIPKEIYHFPSSKFVAKFIGLGCLISATYTDHAAENEWFTFSQNCIAQNPFKFSFYDRGEKILVQLRPEDIHLSENSAVRGIVIAKEFQTGNYLYKIKLIAKDKKSETPNISDSPSPILLALMPTSFEKNIHDEVGIKIAVKSYSFFKIPNVSALS